MKELKLPDLFEAAARASIIERCAPSYLHDVRGSMQALFSALELLGRSAKTGCHPVRIEKACDLAKRAITHHEKSTMGVLQILMLQPAEAVAVDVGALVSEVAHFLRNDAVAKHVSITVSTLAEVWVSAERPKLQTLLAGLLTSAIDEASPGAELAISIVRRDNDAVISIASAAGYGEIRETEDLWRRPPNGLRPQELTMMYARHFLTSNGGRLEIDAGSALGATLHLYYPCIDRA